VLLEPGLGSRGGHAAAFASFFFLHQKKVESPAGACNEPWHLRRYIIIFILRPDNRVAAN
jgi:hypothetical protein